MINESNAILAQRVLEQDESAFAVIFGRYHERVFSVCLRILGHRQDAEDVTQETFTRAARYLERWDSARPLEPWLIAIAGNRCRTFLASRQGHRSLSPAVEPSINLDPAGPLASLNEEIELALDRLTVSQREAFEMFHRQSLSYDQIAQRMGRPVGTIKTWIHRARRQLVRDLRDREVVHFAAGDCHGRGRSRFEVQR